METILFEGTIRRSALDSQGKALLISDQRVRYGEQEMAVADITDVSEDLTRTTVSGVGAGTSYMIDLKDKAGKRLSIGMSSFMNPADTGGTYFSAHDALDKAVYQRLKQERRDRIAKGEILKTGQLGLSREGVTVTEGLIFKSRKTILWQDLHTSLESGTLHLTSFTDPKVKGQLLMFWWNAPIYRMILEEMAGRGFIPKNRS